MVDVNNPCQVQSTYYASHNNRRYIHLQVMWSHERESTFYIDSFILIYSQNINDKASLSARQTVTFNTELKILVTNMLYQRSK